VTGVQTCALPIYGSTYVSALLADPGPTLGLDGVTDVLVAAPRRSLVVCRPMERAYLGPVVHLDRLSRTLHDDAPDPCTPHVYWWREGALHRIVVDYQRRDVAFPDRKSTRLNSSHVKISYAVFC